MAGAFFRHRGLIAFAAGGAMAEATLLSFLAPSARALAPQVTALPPLAAFHDLRWLFAFNQPWLGFTGALVLLVAARSAVDAVLVMLAWPRATEPGIPRPRFLPSLLSCAVLTVLTGLVMSPVVTLMFGVALLPFSWPYLAAVPILLGIAMAQVSGAVLVVDGFGSTCCHSANALRAAEPNLLVRQFSYVGLNAAGQPIPYGRAGDLPIQVLGDRMAAQVDKLYQQARTPVDIVAESEGTLGLYAMLARHPHVPIGSVVLLSPIVEPGQAGGVDTVPGAALTTLNDLVGGMSPYGRAGAQALIESVSEVGASYFAQVSRDTGRPWLAVVPLADAVTLPACPWPQNVIFIDAFHGGLLGDRSVQQMIEAFLASGTVPDRELAGLAGGSQRDLRGAAQVIAAAASAWRMPDLHSACPPS